MPATIDLHECWKLMPNRANIYYRINDTAGDHAWTITSCYRTGVHRKEPEPNNGTYYQCEVGFQIPTDAEAVPVSIGEDPITFDPKPGDEITDAENFIYKIISVQRPMYNAFWGIRAIRVAIESTLCDKLTWYRQTDIGDIYADRKLDNNIIIASNFNARLQPDGAQLVDMLGKRGPLERYIVWSAQETEPQFGDYFEKVSDPTIRYKVVGFKNRERLNALMRIECVKQP